MHLLLWNLLWTENTTENINLPRTLSVNIQEKTKKYEEVKVSMLTAIPFVCLFLYFSGIFTLCWGLASLILYKLYPIKAQLFFLIDTSHLLSEGEDKSTASPLKLREVSPLVKGCKVAIFIVYFRDLFRSIFGHVVFIFIYFGTEIALRWQAIFSVNAIPVFPRRRHVFRVASSYV